MKRWLRIRRSVTAQVEPSQAVVRSVQFHPNGQMLLTAGLDKSLRLFQIDGGRNPKVQTVFLEDMPIHKAAFSADGSQVCSHCSSPRAFFASGPLAERGGGAGDRGGSEKALLRVRPGRGASAACGGHRGACGEVVRGVCGVARRRGATAARLLRQRGAHPAGVAQVTPGRGHTQDEWLRTLRRLLR
jgi:hypothetical protein